jgi:hypothetical protein
VSASSLHERRVGLLATLAALAGCRAASRLEPGLAPDVLTADHRLRVLFVGDAKATETAGCAATARRLRRYLRATQTWRAAGYTVRVVLCASGEAKAWEAALLRLAAEVHAPLAAHGHAAVGADDGLAWVDLPSTKAARRAASTTGDGSSSAVAAASGPVLRVATTGDDTGDPGCCLGRVLVLPHPLDEPALPA